VVPPETERIEENLKIPGKLPVLSLRGLVVYPFIIMPLSVSRPRSIGAVDHALAGNRMVFLLAQKDQEVEDPRADDHFKMGTVAVIMRMLKLPDNRVRVLVQGLCRARVKEYADGNSPRRRSRPWTRSARVEAWSRRLSSAR
jgi:ATP-dependent Lon protease